MVENHNDTQVKGLSEEKGVRIRSDINLLGFPLYDIAFGSDRRSIGHARGIIAIGNMATGVFAIGFLARGFICLGCGCLGVIPIGAISLGLLGAYGGLAIAPFAYGGLAIGIFAYGGLAIGAVAIGGLAVGYYACGGVAVAYYAISGTVRDPEAVEFFSKWAPWVLELIDG